MLIRRFIQRQINSFCAELVFFILFFLAMATTPCLAVQDLKQSPKVIMFISDQLKLSDLSEENAPNLYRLAEENSLGLVALQKIFAYKNVPSAFYATVNSGTTASGMETSFLLYEQTLDDRKQSALLKRRAQQIILYNQEKNTVAHFGALGNALHRKGLKTAAIGIAPSGKVSAEFLTMLMDDSGSIDYLSLHVKKYPSNRSLAQSDSKELERKFKELYERSSLIAVHLGDLEYLDSSEHGAKSFLRTAAIREIDKSLQSVLDVIDNHDLLIVLMPFNRVDLKYGISGGFIAKGEPLSPVVFRGGSYKGILMSTSTRRDGVIIASDLMPTILHHLRIKAELNYTGTKVYSKKFSRDKFQFLQRLSERAVRHDMFMLPVLIFMAVSGLMVIIFAVLNLILGVQPKLARLLKILLVAVFLFPSALSLLALFDIKSLEVYFLLIVVLLLLSYPLILSFKDEFWPMTLALGLTPFLLFIDTLTGQIIANNSLFGNSLLAGGRYYGLGNQYLGLMFIYTILFFVFLGLVKPQVTKKIIFKCAVGLVLGLLVVVLGLARLGANFGALVTLSASLPYLFFRFWSDRKLLWGHYIVLGLLTVMLILGGVIYDVQQKPRAQSHIARSLSLTENKGIAVAANLVKGKVARNLEETTLVLFKWGLFPVSLLLFLFFYFFREKFLSVRSVFPYFFRFVPGIALAGTIAFFFNDTGIEPFAIISVYAFAAFLYLCLTTLSEPRRI